MQNMLHSHYFIGTTSVVDDHQHQFSGVTSNDPDVIGHIHSIESDTSMNNGHTHHYRIKTGAAIYVAGGHYHYYQGETDVADVHVHLINGFSSMHSETIG